MPVLRYSRGRIRAFLDEISRLKGAEFPYRDAEEALTRIGKQLETQLEYLDRLTDDEVDKNNVHLSCTAAHVALFVYLPILGFLIRSTSLRNAFELHGPLLRLAKTLLGDRTKLVLSSEWDYSPYTYLEVPALKGFLLIGLPAPESANPMLFPLAGHELGHSVWSSESLRLELAPAIENTIVSEIRESRWEDFSRAFPGVDRESLATDVDAKQTWEPAYDWARRQVEETFCDFFGVFIFGKSYLHAFAYLLAPNWGGIRSVTYPNMRERAAYLVATAAEYGFEAPKGYVDLFKDLPEPRADEQPTRLLLDLADTAAKATRPTLRDRVRQIASAADITGPDSVEADAIYTGFKDHVIPALKPKQISDITTAAWTAFHDSDLWSDRPGITSKDTTLKELVLKSIEVLEFEQRVHASP